MLYYRNIWLSIGWFLVLLIWVMSLIPVPESIDIKITYFDKVEHMLAYFMLMAWFAQLYHKRSTRLLYAVGFVAMGLVIEVMQGMGEVRLFDLNDIVANIAGVILAWLFVTGSLTEILAKLENRIKR